MKKIIEEYKLQCLKWNDSLKHNGLCLVYNMDLDNLIEKEIRFILVADNPGKDEVKLARYLVGPAGISARVFFERALVNDFKKEVLVLNKSPIYSNVTEDLENLKVDDFSEQQKYMVEMIIGLQQIIGAPIIISGYSNGLIKRNNKLVFNNKSFKPFFEEFAKAVKENRIGDYYIISHFSRNMFYHAENVSIEDYEKCPKEFLLKQGILNREMFENGCGIL